MKNKLTRNWGLKLASFLFAAVLWLIVTNINDPVGTFRVYNVPVKIQNANLITDNEQVYEVLDNTDVIDTVTIMAKRSIIDSLDESNVIATADMNDLTNVNTINIRLSTNKYNDKLESITGNIDSVKLNIENKRTKTLQIRTATTGTVREGYMVGESALEQNLIEISGPESVISQVKTAMATVNVSGFTNNIGTDAEIRLYDEEGKVITSDSIVQNISQVRVTVEILERKTVPIKWEVTGIPATGYLATGEMNSTRSNVVIAGRTNVIKNVNAISIPDSVLDITDATENFSTIINLNEYLPDGVVLAEEDFKGKIQIDVFIEPVAERRLNLYMNRIQFLNMPEGFVGEVSEEDAYCEITLTGLSQNINAVDLNDIQASIDVAEFMRTHNMEELETGYYTMEVDYVLPEEVEVKETTRLMVAVTQAE